MHIVPLLRNKIREGRLDEHIATRLVACSVRTVGIPVALPQFATTFAAQYRWSGTVGITTEDRGNEWDVRAIRGNNYSPSIR